MTRYPCSCQADGCKCGAEVAIEGEPCRFCRAGHQRRHRGGSLHVRFVPHLNTSLTKEAAERHGLQRDPETKGTWIPSEKKLNEYLATEKGHGREVYWRQH